MYALTCENIIRKVADDFTLGPINLEFPVGTITAIVGNNGAGKSTLFQSMSGDYPGEGVTKILGHNIHHKEGKASYSYMPQTFSEILPFSLKQLHNLHAAHDPAWNESRFQSSVAKFNLPLRKKINKLSIGMQRKALIALQLSRDTSLLLLDEPFAGLDMEGQAQLERTIFSRMEEDSDCTIIFATHVAGEVQRLADYIVFMKQGKTLEPIEKDLFAQSWKRIWLRQWVTGLENAPGVREVKTDPAIHILTGDAIETERWLSAQEAAVLKRETLNLHESLPLLLQEEDVKKGEAVK